MQRGNGTKRERHVPLLVPVWMIIVRSASCLIYPCFYRNVFPVELIIWPNTHICCQLEKQLLKFSLFAPVLPFLLSCLTL